MMGPRAARRTGCRPLGAGVPEPGPARPVGAVFGIAAGVGGGGGSTVASSQVRSGRAGLRRIRASSASIGRRWARTAIRASRADRGRVDSHRPGRSGRPAPARRSRRGGPGDWTAAGPPPAPRPRHCGPRRAPGQRVGRRPTARPARRPRQRPSRSRGPAPRRSGRAGRRRRWPARGRLRPRRRPRPAHRPADARPGLARAGFAGQQGQAVAVEGLATGGQGRPPAGQQRGRPPGLAPGLTALGIPDSIHRDSPSRPWASSARQVTLPGSSEHCVARPARPTPAGPGQTTYRSPAPESLNRSGAGRLIRPETAPIEPGCGDLRPRWKDGGSRRVPASRCVARAGGVS